MSLVFMWIVSGVYRVHRNGRVKNLLWNTDSKARNPQKRQEPEVRTAQTPYHFWRTLTQLSYKSVIQDLSKVSVKMPEKYFSHIHNLTECRWSPSRASRGRWRIMWKWRRRWGDFMFERGWRRRNRMEKRRKITLLTTLEIVVVAGTKFDDEEFFPIWCYFVLYAFVIIIAVSEQF